MIHSIFAMVLAGSLVLAGNAAAMERWDFGRLAYGSKVEKKPSGAKDWECPPGEGCYFTDDLGVEYVTWAGDEIVTKKFIVTPGRRDNIPYGIDYAQDTQSVLSTIKRKTNKTLECSNYKGSADREFGLVCHAIVIEGDPGVVLIVSFGTNGKLREIHIWTHYF